MKKKFDVEMIAHVEIEMDDYEDVVGRVLNNVNGWKDHFYPLNDRDGVLEMLAYNAVANGETDAKRLDGWADLQRGACTMNVVEAFIDTAEEIL